MDTKQKRMEILRQVENGEMDLAKASRMLQALEELENQSPWESKGQSLEIEDPGETLPPENPGFSKLVEDELPIVGPAREPQSTGGEFSRAPLEVGQPSEGTSDMYSEPRIPHSSSWRGLWILPFILGFFLIIASAGWMLQGYQAAGLSWGFWFSLFPFGLGVLLMWGGWEMRVARWLNVRIKNSHGKGPHSISFGFPLPVGLTRWSMQRFGRFSPLKAQEVGEFLNQMDQAVATDGPVHVFVDDKDGDQVEIWIDDLKS